MAIDINIPSQVAQTITNGVTGTAPSQDAVFDALALKENTSNKGIANGYVPLNSSTKVDSSYLPSYVDDVIEVANFAALPVTGETGKIYITINTGLIYRWSGSIYVQIGGQDPVWGAITGTLSNQTDLQTALNGKFNNPTGTTSQYIKGDGTLGTSVSGTVTSVGLTMPSAFTVASSPITGSGTIAVTGAGIASQYVRGDGQLATLPTSSGGGSSLSYYLNGSVAQGTFGGNAYKQLSKTPVIGAGTDFTINADGYIARFITDAGDPSFLSIPSGNWNLGFFFQASSGGGSPTFYVNVYKYNGGFTLIGTNSTAPEGITNGTLIDSYFTSVTIPTTTLNLTDRLAIDIYVVHSGRTITLHTEDNHLCQVITTFSTGLAALNGLTSQVQYLATGTSGTDFAINSTTDTHTFNIPTASSTKRGLLSTTDWSTFNGKVGTARSISTTTPLSGGGDLSADRTLSIADAAADGTTKGAATFTASDFNATSGVISIDYANGQSADGTNKGFLTAANWTTFNSKESALTFSTPLSRSTNTISIPAATTSVNGYLSSTDWTTFNSKADINPRVQSVTSSATVTPTNLNDLVVITAQAAGLTIANPTGTMVQGQALMIRIKDNATAQTIAFGTNYRAIGITLPTTTVISKTLYLGCIWNATDTKFDVVGLNQEA